MNEEILNKLHTALFAVSPLASDRDRLIEEMGETIWLESLAKVLEMLPDESRAQVVALLHSDQIDKAIEIADATGIDVDAVITDVATSVMNEVMATVEKAE